MKSVVMIANTFPPEGSAGTYRPLRFIRHLPFLGWTPSVISSDKYIYERYDPGLLTLIPHETEVLRVRGRDPWQAIQAWRARRQQNQPVRVTVETRAETRTVPHGSLRSRLRRAVETAERWHYHPDTAISWIRPAAAATIQVCARKQANVIWATIGPISSGIVARRASQRTGVPYVLDFRDPWGLDYYDAEIRRPVWARRADRLTLYRVLEGAQAVVFQFATVAECYWRAYRGALNAARIHIIPNGYDGALQDSVIPDAPKCTILYAGTLSTYYCYDPLLQALHALKKSDPAQVERLRLLFVGDSMERLAIDVARHGLSDIVEIAGSTSRAEIARLEREAHALLILGRDSTRKGHELVAGAKLFEYLKARRPIMGVLPQDETRKILARVGASLVADVDSRSEIVAVLRHLLDAWSAGTLLSLLPDRAACEVYSAERQTEALVRALEGVRAAVPFIPGSVEIPPSFRRDVAEGGWMSPSSIPNGLDGRSHFRQRAG